MFVTGVLRSWFSPEKTRAILAGKREIWGYPLAAILGVLTPFCSCSSVPLFIGFVSAGIPLGATFSFLIAGPMVGPVGLGLLYGLVGWKIATIYLVFGFSIATVAGYVMGGGLSAWANLRILYYFSHISLCVSNFTAPPLCVAAVLSIHCLPSNAVSIGAI